MRSKRNRANKVNQGGQNEKTIVRFDPVMKYAIDDIFGVENYDYEEDGSLTVTLFMPSGPWLYGFLLGFGDKAKVLEPLELRKKIAGMAESISRVYHP